MRGRNVSTRIFFRDNWIAIDTIPEPFVAASLIATLNGAQIDITRVDSSFVFASPLWSDVAGIDGSTFPTSDAAMAYLRGQFAMRRPVGTVITSYAIDAVAGMTVNHGLAYAPRITIVDSDGDEVTTDVTHAPGQTTLMFAAPFTGTLYLG